MDILQFLDKNLAVISTLIATLISSGITYFIQKNTNKSKLVEMAHQSNLKIKEQEYVEKRQIIFSILKFLEVLNQPNNFNIHTTQETGTLYLIGSRELITNQLSEFHVNYSLYMNEAVSNSLYQLTSSFLDLEQMDFDFHRSRTNNNQPFDDELASYCNESAKKVFADIENFKLILRNQLILG